jgi:hypothetical protein
LKYLREEDEEGGSLHVINLAGWLAGWRFSVGEVGMLFNNFRLN